MTVQLIPLPMRPRDDLEEGGEDMKVPSAVRLSASGTPEAVLSLRSATNLRVGRSRVCELYFADEHVSREHGLLWRSDEDGTWRYRDLGSSNGTRLSRSGAMKTVRAGVPVRLQPGDVLLIGDKGSRLELLAKSPAPPMPQASVATTHFKEELALAARHLLPIVFFGPSGSGKTWAARRVHELSGRKGAFVPINCGRLPKSATELRSELLGHVAGAFTDAKTSW